MHHDFWHARWQAKQIGFHLSEVNPLLIKYFPILELSPNSRIFVPLCGKTLDIHWFLAQGFRVVGVELSTIAVEELFSELKLVPALTKIGELTRYSATNIDIFNGDFFTLTAEMLGEVDAIYDRAALVALPAKMRKDYTAHVSKISQCAPQLLITFFYDQTLLDGPPFCVNANELRAHYATDYAVQMLANVPATLKGEFTVNEQVWMLSR